MVNFIQNKKPSSVGYVDNRVLNRRKGLIKIKKMLQTFLLFLKDPLSFCLFRRIA